MAVFLLEVEGEIFFIDSKLCTFGWTFIDTIFFLFLFLRNCSKFKVARGGGRHFSRDLDPRFNKPVSESSEEESSEEESSEDETAQQNEQLAPEMAALNLKLGNTVALDDEDQEPGMSRAEKKAMKKAQGEKKVTIQEPEDSGSESDEEEVMPAPVPKGKAKVAKKAEPVQMSRKER